MVKKNKKTSRKSKLKTKVLPRKINQKKRTKFSTIFLKILITILLLLIIFILINSYSNKPEPKNTTPFLTKLHDECSFIAGKLIHQIRDTEDCELQCKNHCFSQELEFSHTEFNPSNDSCHECSCYCI